jgi:hypothetical protein
VLISFCTACHNRLHQFREVFEENLRIVMDSPDTEWAILNYNSTDDLHSFMLDQLPRAQGRLIYARESSGRRWECSLAKNIAHKISSGDILMNLDSDNRIATAVQDICMHLHAEIGALHLSADQGTKGTFGRIVVRRELFYKIGGYDESFLPMGFQDADLLRRVAKVALCCRIPCETGIALRNNKEDSIQHCHIGNLTWSDFDAINGWISDQKILARQYTANQGRAWGAGQVEFFAGQGTVRKVP